MRFLNISLSVLPVLIFIGTSGARETGLQFETTGRFAIQESTAPLAPETFYGGGMNTTVHAARQLSPNVSLFIGERHELAGGEIDNWRIMPNYATLRAGCELEGPGIIDIDASATQYPFAKQYSPSFMPPSEALTPDWLNRIGAHWTAGNDKPVSFDGDLSCFNYRYDLAQKNTGLSASELTEGRYGPQTDNDLWSSLSLRSNLPADLYLQLATRFKSDMEPSSAHDLHNQSEGTDEEYRDREDPVPDCAGARCRQPPQRHREDHNRHYGD